MKELAKQVRMELIRTLFWLVVALSVSIGLYFMIW